MTINSSSIPTSTAGKSSALLAGLSGDTGAAKRSGQNFAQLLGSVTQPPAKPAQPPLPERAPMPRMEVEPSARERDLPRSTEPVPRAPERAPEPAERSNSANTAAAKSETTSAASAKPAAKAANAPANATAKTSAKAGKAPDQTDAAATDKATALADDAVAGEVSTGKRGAKAAADDDAGLAATLLGTATAEPAAAGQPAQEVVLAAASCRYAGDEAASPSTAATAATADPASLASLMPSIAQAVFGQAAADPASGTSGGSTKADTAASPVTTGDGALPLPGAELAVASAQAGAAARAKTEPVAADPAQQAAAASVQRAESPSVALANAAQESTKALAIDTKPQVGAASFGQLLQAATAAAPTGPNNAQPSAATAAAVTVHSSLHEPGFAPEMATRLTLLASEGVQRAQLHLNPAEMGPVSVQIQLDGQQAQVEFHAQHAATREVLERSLPELAAALRDAGMTLSGGGVFQQPRDAQQDSQAQNQASRQGANGKAGTSGSSDNIGPTIAQQAGRRTQVGVLDMYA